MNQDKFRDAQCIVNRLRDYSRLNEKLISMKSNGPANELCQIAQAIFYFDRDEEIKDLVTLFQIAILDFCDRKKEELMDQFDKL